MAHDKFYRVEYDGDKHVLLSVRHVNELKNDLAREGLSGTHAIDEAFEEKTGRDRSEITYFNPDDIHTRAGRKTGAKKASKPRAKRSRKWIQKAIKPSKKGALHKALHVPAGKKIPLKTLRSAAKKKGKLGHRARLALTMRGFKHPKKSKKARK
jgi:hypothetical protein